MRINKKTRFYLWAFSAIFFFAGAAEAFYCVITANRSYVFFYVILGICGLLMSSFYVFLLIRTGKDL
ncbi:hypothetical protein [Dictyobacter aurantiacus]|uniref:Uncharacterized protein n=1 Tax=Dictyobacter aurantiacus TaxID=1936993 RepID=A0A401ZFE4_9CHLR|nr:hypothetical protein [Dictyobacter aurantiacus]GCE05418.1 hypothetical protein KDAU_27470 [Dictyobacter aurantiacus]